MSVVIICEMVVKVCARRERDFTMRAHIGVSGISRFKGVFSRDVHHASRQFSTLVNPRASFKGAASVFRKLDFVVVGFFSLGFRTENNLGLVDGRV